MLETVSNDWLKINGRLRAAEARGMFGGRQHDNKLPNSCKMCGYTRLKARCSQVLNYQVEQSYGYTRTHTLYWYMQQKL